MLLFFIQYFLTPINIGIGGAEGKLKEEIDSYINFGNLVPDDLILRLLQEKIKKEDCKNGFILDGYPRNANQIKDLKKILKIDKLVYIKLSDSEAIKRVKGRMSCKKCKIEYNSYVKVLMPKKVGICDKCGEKLTQREDDVNDEAIKKRLEIYYSEINPLIEAFEYVEVDGEKTIDEVTEEILGVLKV